MLYERRTKKLNISCDLLEEILKGTANLSSFFKRLGEKTEIAQMYIDVPLNVLIIELYNPEWKIVPDGSSPEEIGVSNE